MTMFLLRPMLLMVALMAALVAGTVALGDTLEHQQELIYVDAINYPSLKYVLMDMDNDLKMPLLKRDIYAPAPIRFSPDARFMILTDSDGFLVVYEIDTGRSIDLPTRYDMNIWSGDSRTMIYRNKSSLMIFDTGNWTSRPLLEMPLGLPVLVWPEDSHEFWLYQTESNGKPITMPNMTSGNRTGSAFEIDPHTGEIRAFAVEPACFPSTTPVMSRNGRYMACFVLPDDNDRQLPDIYVYELNNSKNVISGHRISGSDGAGFVKRLVWSPDGKQILAQASHNGIGRISLYDVATGAETPILTDVRTIGLPSWSPDGEFIVAQTIDRSSSDYFIYNVNMGSAEYVSDDNVNTGIREVPSIQAVYVPQWSQDSHYFSLVSSDRRDSRFCYPVVVSVDTGEFQQIAEAWPFSHGAGPVGWRP